LLCVSPNNDTQTDLNQLATIIGKSFKTLVGTGSATAAQTFAAGATAIGEVFKAVAKKDYNDYQAAEIPLRRTRREIFDLVERATSRFFDPGKG